MNIRLETPADYRAVEELTREAFWGTSMPTCDEHYLVHRLRTSPAFLQELDFVAELDGKLVGNIMYSQAKVTDASGREHEVLTFGPLSILPSHQRRGIGATLMRHSILRARELGYKGIVFYGHPDYYPRFGFQNAAVFGITSADGENFDALMAMELYDNALCGISGRFSEDSVFHCDMAEATRYDAQFPAKEPAEMIPITVLLQALPADARHAFEQHEITTLAWLNRLSGRELFAWDGIDERTLHTINSVLRQYALPEKLLPDCDILQKAKRGIQGWENNGE